MARFIVWSDLHDEFHRGFDFSGLEKLGADAVLIGGDTDTHGRHIDFGLAAIEALGIPVVMIWGNHEAYGSNFDQMRAAERIRLKEIHGHGVALHVLHGDSVVIAGTRVIGATLWTDFDLDPSVKPFAMRAARRAMADYSCIGRDDETAAGDERALTTEDTMALHAEERAKIFGLLDAPFAGPTVVMTHHIPSGMLIGPDFHGSLLNGAFASEMTRDILVRPVHSWIYGHSHSGREIELDGVFGPVRFIHNPRGYPGEASTISFDRTRIIET